MQLFGRERERRPPPPGRPRLRRRGHALVPRHGDLRLDSAGDALDPPRRRDDGRQRARIARDRLAIALLIGALRRNSRWLALFSGVAAGVTLFYSLDIGLYSVGGGVLALIWIALLARRAQAVIAPLIAFVAGIALGAAPFLDLPRRARRDRRVRRDVVRRHPAHHRRRLVAAVSRSDHDLPQQSQPAHAGRLRPLRALPIHPQSARDRHRADRARAARRHAPQRRARPRRWPCSPPSPSSRSAARSAAPTFRINTFPRS